MRPPHLKFKSKFLHFSSLLIETDFFLKAELKRLKLQLQMKSVESRLIINKLAHISWLYKKVKSLTSQKVGGCVAVVRITIFLAV